MSGRISPARCCLPLRELYKMLFLDFKDEFGYKADNKNAVKHDRAADVTIEVYVMCPSDDLWEEYQKKRKMDGTFERYKKQAEEMEFPNPIEGIV